MVTIRSALRLDSASRTEGARSWGLAE